MSRPLVSIQQKLAEKLSIINDRGVGMLTRIYNIKKVSKEASLPQTRLPNSGLESSNSICCTAYRRAEMRNRNQHSYPIRVWSLVLNT